MPSLLLAIHSLTSDSYLVVQQEGEAEADFDVLGVHKIKYEEGVCVQKESRK